MYALKKDKEDKYGLRAGKPGAENPKDYDLSFAQELKHIYPLYEVEPFLEYHYERTPDKGLFLKHLEYHILLFPFLRDEQQNKCQFIKEWIESKLLGFPENQPNSVLLLENLKAYGFDTLPMVKAKGIDQLIDLFIGSDVPYIIAFFQKLEFLDHMKREHCNYSNKELYKKLSVLLNTSERTIQGNISVLNPNSQEDRNRYTAHNHIESVEKDFISI